MGNRALVVFHNDDDVSPTVYLHWNGDDVPYYLEQLKLLMATRLGDPSYAAARFVGICHNHISGPMSLGVMANTFAVADVKDPERMAAESHGDAGMVVVDTADFSWKAYGGALEDYQSRAAPTTGAVRKPSSRSRST
jgi:hypothetical protein